MTPKERFFATIEGKPHDRAPVTPIVMQWAAHHIGETYRHYTLNGDVLAKAQIAVAQDYNTDWVSVMSDPWCESSGYGMEFDYPEEATGVPHEHLIHSLEEATRLPDLNLDDERPQIRMRCIECQAEQVGDTHPIIGWVEGPIAQYSDLRQLELALMDLMDDPAVFHQVAEHLVTQAIRFAKAQIDCGATVIGIGDAAASVIDPDLYHDLVLPWEQKLIAGIHEAGVPVKLHICGNLKPILHDVVTTGADVIDLDWMVPMQWAREVAPDQVFAGNFDPAAILLLGSQEDVHEAAKTCLAQGGDRLMLQPGCEVPVGTPDENMRAFCPN